MNTNQQKPATARLWRKLPVYIIIVFTLFLVWFILTSHMMMGGFSSHRDATSNNPVTSNKAKEKNMKLGYVIIYTTNVGESIDFYEKVFKLERRFVHESGQYAEMETGATALAFVDDELASTNVAEYRKNNLDSTPAGVEIVLVSAEVEKAYNHAIDNGATAVKEPETKPWGQVVGYVRDNNGVLVELASPMG